VTDEPHLTIDARDKRCPIPVIELARHIGEVPLGAIIAVLSNDPAARLDVPEWCRMRQQEYVGERPIDSASGKAADRAADNATAYLVKRLR
jgi:cysteine desulfurase